MPVGAPSLEKHLNALVDGSDAVARRAADPVSFVHRYRGRGDREVVGLVAASLAFGNVAAVRASIAKVLAVLGNAPARAIATRSERELAEALDGFVHRVYRGRDVARLLANAAAVRREHGSLGAAFEAHLAQAGEFREALARFADALRGVAPGRGMKHLVPDPRAGSACKRLMLYLRWMIRPADGIDLGSWNVDPALLLIPVDTHIQRIAHNLRLTKRRDASWRTAEEITGALRVYAPHDPVRYDFALCHHGISGDCPSRRDDARCASCVLRPVCRHWTKGSQGARRGGASRTTKPR